MLAMKLLTWHESKIYLKFLSFLRENGNISHYFSALGSLMHFLQLVINCNAAVQCLLLPSIWEKGEWLFLVRIFIASFFVDILFLPPIYRIVFPLYFVVKHLLFVFCCKKSKQETLFPVTFTTIYNITTANIFYGFLIIILTRYWRWDLRLSWLG